MICANVFCGAGRECAVTEKGEPTCLCIEVSPEVGSQKTVAKGSQCGCLAGATCHSSANDFIIFMKIHLVCLKDVEFSSQELKMRCKFKDVFSFLKKCLALGAGLVA